MKLQTLLPLLCNTVEPTDHQTFQIISYKEKKHSTEYALY